MLVVTLRFSKLILMLFLGLLSQAWARDMPDDRSLAFPSNTTIPASTFANQTPGSSWYGGIGSGIGNALSSGLSGAGYYLGKLVPSSVTNFFNDLGKSAMAKGISAYNYIASLAPESPVLEGGALQAAEDGLIALKDQATDLLEQAIQLNQRLTAYAGVSEQYQRPAAIGLLVGETVATIAMLYYAIGLIKAALAAEANKSLTRAGGEATSIIDKQGIDSADQRFTDTFNKNITSFLESDLAIIAALSHRISSVETTAIPTSSGTIANVPSNVKNMITSLYLGEYLTEDSIVKLAELYEKNPNGYNSFICRMNTTWPDVIALMLQEALTSEKTTDPMVIGYSLNAWITNNIYRVGS
ncbi:MAG TPA: hypothetical protein VHA52_04315 [Candidatus Babeliaceae bacterium]|nr:hypothetical protein [Candidatus Babeliaceae bacterium]